MATDNISVKAAPTAEPYLLNCWYVAAWASELQPGQHRKRVLLDRSVLLLRDEDGIIAAIDDICPHRFASLSKGSFAAGVVQCPYHGLRFDMGGQCVHNPHGDGRIAERARVPHYPLVERYGALWIWFGNAEAADPALIPDLSLLDSVSADKRAPGYLRTEASYQLLSDNILDLTHADFIHQTTLGTGGELAGSEARARHDGNIVTVEWSFTGKGMRIVRPLWKDAELLTRFRVTWHPPGIMTLQNRISAVGGDGSETSSTGVHIMTPETAYSTHYFFENGEADRRDKLELALRVFKDEDGVILEDVQRNMGNRDFWEMEPLILANDGGAVLARRILRRLIRQEQAASGKVETESCKTEAG